MIHRVILSFFLLSISSPVISYDNERLQQDLKLILKTKNKDQASPVAPAKSEEQTKAAPKQLKFQDDLENKYFDEIKIRQAAPLKSKKIRKKRTR